LKSKFFGVVEGFYRRTYTFDQRCDLIKYLSVLGLNTYIYGPKSDPFHRKEWPLPYPTKTLKEFEILSELSKKNSIIFNYALSPMAKPDVKKMILKVDSMIKIGISSFSLFYDDIKVLLTKKIAKLQADSANELYEFLKTKLASPVLFFCPTQYRGFDRNEYITTVARKLRKNIEIFWTGKRVVSRKITENDIDRITEILERPPLIWDNLFANDYIPGIILKFPYRHREPGIIQKVIGIVINPMNQYEWSKPLIYTAAKFFKDPYNYRSKEAWQEAINSQNPKS